MWEISLLSLAIENFPNIWQNHVDMSSFIHVVYPMLLNASALRYDAIAMELILSEFSSQLGFNGRPIPMQIRFFRHKVYVCTGSANNAQFETPSAHNINSRSSCVGGDRYSWRLFFEYFRLVCIDFTTRIRHLYWRKPCGPGSLTVKAY